MKRYIAIILPAFLLFFSTLMAQETGTTTTGNNTNNESFGKGSNVINAGVGIGGVYSYWGSGYSQLPNLVLSYENGTFGNVGPGTISLGALVSYKTISYNYSYPSFYYHQRWEYWILGLRSAYHWNFTHSAKCDPYIGLMAAYYIVNYRLSTDNPDFGAPGSPYYYIYNASYASYFALSAYLGFRYYLTPTVGLWAELGYGYTTLAAGVNFKL